MQNEISRGGLSEEERNNCHVFCWYNKEGHTVEVDLITGQFNVNGQIMHASRGDIENLSNRSDINYRMIYARRHFFGQGVIGQYDDVGLYLIGYQFTEAGRNYKRILYIYPNGEIIFGGED